MSRFTHFDARGKAHMVDVGAKQPSERVAIAEGRIRMRAATLEKIRAGSHDKGDVLSVARLAAIMATKRTADLIPLCHPIALTHVGVELEADPELPGILSRATAKTVGPTGVEMEAMMAVQVALLTIYDMCKAVDRGMCIEAVRLTYKSGGRSGEWSRQDDLSSER